MDRIQIVERKKSAPKKIKNEKQTKAKNQLSQKNLKRKSSAESLKVSDKKTTLKGSRIDPLHLSKDWLEKGSHYSQREEALYSNAASPGNLHEQSALQKFAQDLITYWRTPSYLKQHSQYIYGWVRIKKLDDRYILTKHRGTPYGRALTYETLKEVLARKIYLQDLLKAEVQEFEVHYIFRSYPQNESFQEPELVKVENNRITIHEYKFQNPNALVKYVTAFSNPANGLAMVGPNVLAPLQDLMSMMQEKEKIPAEVRALHASPAFKRSF